MKINKYIDHTMLKRDAVTADVDAICDEAIKYDFAAVCTHPIWMEHVRKRLEGTGILAAAVVGFPFGTQTIESKVFEGVDAIKKGAQELDYVITVSKVHERDTEYLTRELTEIRKATQGTTIKLILETGLLDNEEKEYISKLAVDAGWDFIKTATGIMSTGATVEDVELMVNIAKEKGAQVKASGGVKTPEDAEAMIKAGATRIGSSNGVKLMRNEEITDADGY